MTNLSKSLNPLGPLEPIQPLMPLLAYGTWVENLRDAYIMTGLVREALRIGYTHIDTAKIYGTEQYVFQAIRESLIPRKSIYLTSKITGFVPIKTLQRELGTIGYYDMLLLHYPPLNITSSEAFKKEIRRTWTQMQDYIDTGVAKAIGVSNFYFNHLRLLLEVCHEDNLILPSVNQIEIHPGDLHLDYVPYMQSEEVIPFAHTPLGGLGSQYILNNEILIAIGDRIGATPAQVVIAYLLKRGIGVVTRSTNSSRMEESLIASTLINSLTNDDIDRINETESGLGPLLEGSQAAWEQNSRLH